MKTHDFEKAAQYERKYARQSAFICLCLSAIYVAAAYSMRIYGDCIPEFIGRVLITLAIVFLLAGIVFGIRPAFRDGLESWRDHRAEKKSEKRRATSTLSIDP